MITALIDEQERKSRTTLAEQSPDNGIGSFVIRAKPRQARPTSSALTSNVIVIDNNPFTVGPRVAPPKRYLRSQPSFSLSRTYTTYSFSARNLNHGTTPPRAVHAQSDRRCNLRHKQTPRRVSKHRKANPHRVRASRRADTRPSQRLQR
jgi:hypothetical protein